MLPPGSPIVARVGAPFPTPQVGNRPDFTPEQAEQLAAGSSYKWE